MGVKVPLAGLYMNFQNDLNAVGVEGSNNLVNVDFHDVFPAFKYPGYDKFYKQWRNAWLKCKNQPFNSKLFENGNMIVGAYTLAPYWLLSVIERAKSIDPEKIIKIWEGDTYQYANGRVVKMRACDHKEIMNVTVNDFVPPERQRVSMNIPPHFGPKRVAHLVRDIQSRPAKSCLGWTRHWNVVRERVVGVNRGTASDSVEHLHSAQFHVL